MMKNRTAKNKAAENRAAKNRAAKNRTTKNRTTKNRTQKKELKKYQKILIGIAVTVLFLLVLLSVIFFVLKALGKKHLEESVSGETPVMEEADREEEWEEGWIRYNGKIYAYNEDIMTFLVMGIDDDGEVKKAKDGISGGQADALFLGVMNPHNKSVSIIAINRNTMTAVDVYDKDGIYLGQYDKQITLQHGYGDGMELSCERSVAAVSRLFYNLPISGYVAINMGAIPELNDAVGGVQVTVLDDVIYPEYDMDLHQGDEVTLTGHQAYWYVRGRNENVFNSSALRLERQKQFLTNFISQAKNKAMGNVTVAVDLYNTISRYMVTDVDVTEFTYLASEALGYEFSIDNLYTMEGETLMGESFEEFYPDEDALHQLVIDVFYEPVE